MKLKDVKRFEMLTDFDKESVLINSNNMQELLHNIRSLTSPIRGYIPLMDKLREGQKDVSNLSLMRKKGFYIPTWGEDIFSLKDWLEKYPLCKHGSYF